jgi:NhaP-type Na+/H+ or K+/H+ antiporter
LPLLAGSAAHRFSVSALVLGVLLVVGALVSGLAGRSFLSLTAMFVLVGFVLGPAALGVLDFSARSEFVRDLATVALIVILFRDGLEVDAEMLQTQWRLPLRKLVIAMPLTAVIVAAGAKLLVGLTWTESFLLGALLSPTDPVLSSGVVTNPRVPRVIRHSLNLESGLNDGLALPAVLAFSAALRIGGSGFVWWRFVLENVGIGLAVGLLCGLAASLVLPRGEGIADHMKALCALGFAFACYAVAALIPNGNGLIAVFVAAITLGLRRPDVRECFEDQAETVVEIVKLGVFVVFGSLLTGHGLLGDGWGAVGVVVVTLFVARPVAVFVALARTSTSTAAKAFMSWFGPKGVATMTFALLVLTDQITARVEIFNLAALVVFVSAVLHGVTDTPGVDWIAKRAPTEVAEDRPEPHRTKAPNAASSQ